MAERYFVVTHTPNLEQLVEGQTLAPEPALWKQYGHAETDPKQAEGLWKDALAHAQEDCVGLFAFDPANNAVRLLYWHGPVANVFMIGTTDMAPSGSDERLRGVVGHEAITRHLFQLGITVKTADEASAEQPPE